MQFNDLVGPQFHLKERLLRQWATLREGGGNDRRAGARFARLGGKGQQQGACGH